MKLKRGKENSVDFRKYSFEDTGGISPKIHENYMKRLLTKNEATPPQRLTLRSL